MIYVWYHCASAYRARPHSTRKHNEARDAGLTGGDRKLWNYRLLDGVRAVASQESVSIVTSQRIHYSLARRVMTIFIKSDQVGL